MKYSFVRSLFLKELSIFIALYLVSFFVTLFNSELLTNEDRLVEFAKAKISKEAGIEFLLTLIVLGIGMWGSLKLSDRFKSWWMGSLLIDIANELPRALYGYGAAVSALCLAFSIRLGFHQIEEHPPKEFLLMTTSLAWLFFLIGFIFRCWIAERTQKQVH